MYPNTLPRFFSRSSQGGARLLASGLLALMALLAIATPAELGLSSTDKRISRFTGTPPNMRPSMRRNGRTGASVVVSSRKAWTSSK